MTVLYLHIGHPKCGSSSIQKYLQVNAQRLLQQGFGVVDRQLKVAGKASKDTSLVPVFRPMTLDQDNGPALRDKLTAALGKLAASHDKLIVSAENLTAPYMTSLFSELKDRLTIKVIYYIRPQDDWVLSAWKQWYLKSGSSLERAVTGHIKHAQDFYRPTAMAWRDFVGPENFYIQVMNAGALYNGSLLDDFSHHVGFDAGGFDIPAPENQSFDYDILHVLAASPFLFADAHDNALYSFLDDIAGDNIAADRKSDPLGSERRSQLLAAHADENAWLKASFFQDTDFDKWFQPSDKRPPHQPDTVRGLTKLLAVNLKATLALHQEIQQLKMRLGLPSD